MAPAPPRSTQQGRPKPALSQGAQPQHVGLTPSDSRVFVVSPQRARAAGSGHQGGVCEAPGGSPQRTCPSQCVPHGPHAAARLLWMPMLTPRLCLLPPRPASYKHHTPSLSSLSTEVAFATNSRNLGKSVGLRSGTSPLHPSCGEPRAPHAGRGLLSPGFTLRAERGDGASSEGHLGKTAGWALQSPATPQRPRVQGFPALSLGFTPERSRGALRWRRGAGRTALGAAPRAGGH